MASLAPRNQFLDQRYIGIDKSLFFDGVNDYVKVSDWSFGSLNNTHPWSFSFWIKPDATQDANARIFSSQGSAVRGVDIRLNNFLQLAILVYDGGTRQFNFTTLKANVWQYVVLAYSNTENTIKCYVNGVYKNQFNLTFASFLNVDSKLGIGASYSGATRFYKGYLAYFRIYSKELNQQEIIYEHRFIGHILDSTASRCVFELSNQNDIFEADATFVTNHPEFTVGDFIVVNSVQKYNYLKPYSTTTISSFAPNGLKTTVNYNSHGLQNGDVVNIYNTSSYNGPHKIENVTTNTFDIPVTFVASEPSVGRWGTGILEGSHGLLYGKTPSEIGGLNRSSATDIKDFYSGDFVDDVYFVTDNKANYFKSDNILDVDDVINNTNDFVIELEIATIKKFIAGTNGNSVRGAFFSKIQGGNRFDIVYLPFLADGKNALQVLARGSGIFIFTSFVVGTAKRNLKYVHSFSTNDFHFVLDGIRIEAGVNEQPTTDFFSGGGTIYANGFSPFIQVVPETGIALSSLKVYAIGAEPIIHLILNNNQGTTIQSKEGELFTNPYVSDRHLAGGGSWLNKKSLVPSVVEYANSGGSLYFQNQNFIPISTNFSILITFETVDNSLADILLKLVDKDTVSGAINDSGVSISKSIEGGTNPRIRLGRGTSTDLRLDYSYLNLGSSDYTIDENTINTFCINYTRVSADNYTAQLFVKGVNFTDKLTAGVTENITTSIIDTIALGQSGSNLNANLYQVGVSTKLFTAKESAEIGQLGLPPKRWLDESLAYYQFQSGSIFDDGVAAEPVIRDLSGNNYHLEIFGLTGATKADKITDFRTNFVKNINQNK